MTSITASWCTTRYDHFSSMTLYSKLVAAGLAIALLVVPGAALTSCTQNMGGMGKHDSSCVMMGMVSPPINVAIAASNPCCEMSGPENIAQSPFQSPTSSAVYAVSPLALSTFEIPRSTAETKSAEQSRVPSPPPQALLCVFLI